VATETFRMNATYVYGMLLGGSVVSALGGVAEYMKEKEIPSYKSLVRDFLVGAVLVLFLLQIVPDSMTSLVSALPSLPEIPSFTGGLIEPDLQVGPARF
jgi:RsiW-degrading membrane proteinase PrsW (M82 family)